MDLIQWFKLEDIYANLYVCNAYMVSRVNTHRLGNKRRRSEKCLSGCCYALLLILILILPILIFSSLNPAVEINNIMSGKFLIKAEFMGSEERLYFTLFSLNDIEVLPV